MNYKIAFDVLDIDLTEVSYNDINHAYLRKKYHKVALQHHPDKNGNTVESNDKFKLITESYEYLKREINTDTHNTDKDDDADLGPDLPNYLDFLQLFMSGLFDSKYNELLSRIIKSIILDCKNVTKQIFDGIDRETVLKVYSFLSKNRDVLHLRIDILNTIKVFVLDKCGDIMIYYLNPSIDDLFENNVYKLYEGSELFLVPLWHNELYFDYQEEGVLKEIIVFCEPQIPDNMKIDENNNIHTEVHLKSCDIQRYLMEHLDIVVEINTNKKYLIPIEKLYMKREQTYRIKNQGLTKIKDDIYDVSERTDIIVKIIIA